MRAPDTGCVDPGAVPGDLPGDFLRLPAPGMLEIANAVRQFAVAPGNGEVFERSEWRPSGETGVSQEEWLFMIRAGFVKILRFCKVSPANFFPAAASIRILLSIIPAGVRHRESQEV